VPAIIYDFKAIGETLRKQRIDDWWQPAKPEPEPKAAEPAGQYEHALMRKFDKRLSEESASPIGMGLCVHIPKRIVQFRATTFYSSAINNKGDFSYCSNNSTPDPHRYRTCYRISAARPL
jgi:hypothetical protein